MSRHPVTPMCESDLRIHLEAQGLDKLQLVPSTLLDDTDLAADVVRHTPVLFDVVTAQDQNKIAKVLQRLGGRQLLIGASSVAEILAGASPKNNKPAVTALPQSTNTLLFAGSRSLNTKAQVEASNAYHKLVLTPEALSSGGLIAEAVALLRQNTSVLVHLDADVDYGFAPDALADLSSLFVLHVLEQVDIGFLGLAGGDTSSRICAQLGIEALQFEEALGNGVCICSANHSDPSRDKMRIMLKGGQMGAPDLFDQFVAWGKNIQR